jgi:hypothetical protein
MISKVNPIRKAILKENLSKGKSISTSMKLAGYSNVTSITHNSRNHPAVQSCYSEIFSTKKLTPDYVLGNLDKILRETDASPADRTRVCELLGKYLRLWQDQSAVSVHIHTEDAALLSRYAPHNVLTGSPDVTQVVDNQGLIDDSKS